MDEVQKTLYGKFPRAVGVTQDYGGLRQFVVHSEGEFDVFTDTVNGSRNAYASISWRPVGGDIQLDKVSIDLDTPAKPDWPMFDRNDLSDDEIFERMRADPEIADAILGPVFEDAKALCQRLLDDGVPTIGVFSGFGLHIHLLYQETSENLKQKIGTTARKYVGDLNLETYDTAPIGDHKRLMRIPNIERIWISDDGETVRRCNINTIPLSAEEIADGLDPSSMLDRAMSPRTFTPDVGERPEMEVYDHYVQTVDEVEAAEQRDVDDSILGDGDNDELLEYLLQEYLQMPCMYERITQPEPDHRVRQNCAVLLFNLGMSVDEVHDLFARIGWVDYKPRQTDQQLRQIYRTGYSDRSCASIRRDGLCSPNQVDDPKSCSCYGWSGGKAEWK